MRLLLPVFITILFVACSSAPSAPETPVFKTKQGKACAKQCEEEHSACDSNCRLIVGATGGPARQRSNCRAACVRATQACYEACEDSVPPPPEKQ